MLDVRDHQLLMLLLVVKAEFQYAGAIGRARPDDWLAAFEQADFMVESATMVTSQSRTVRLMGWLV